MSGKGERNVISAKIAKCVRPLLCFDNNNGVRVLSYDGEYYCYLFDAKKNELFVKSGAQKNIMTTLWPKSKKNS